MDTIAQAAALPFRLYKNKLKILIITSRNGKKWIIPKGIIEPGDSDRYTALKETREEAGVAGKVLKKKIGSYSYTKWNSLCEVQIYPLQVTEIYDEWPESHFRKRKWVSVKGAVNKIEPKEVAVLLKAFVKNMEPDVSKI